MRMTGMARGSRIVMALRVLAIAIGGWVLASGVAALAGVALQRADFPPADSMLAMALLSFAFYIAIVMWGFADRTSILRPLLIAGLAFGAAMAGKSWAPGVLGG